MCTHSMLLPPDSQGLQQLPVDKLVPMHQNATHSSELQTKISSKYRGLCWDKKHRAWRVRIFYGGKQRHVGRFKDDVTAARAYDKAAVYLYGSKAILNFSIDECLADPTEVSGFITLAKEQAAAADLQQLQLQQQQQLFSTHSGLSSAAVGAVSNLQHNQLQPAASATGADLLLFMSQQQRAASPVTSQQFVPTATVACTAPMMLQQQIQGQQQQWQQQQQQHAACFLPSALSPAQQIAAGCSSGASSPHSMFTCSSPAGSFVSDNIISSSGSMHTQLQGISTSGGYGLPAHLLSGNDACNIAAQPQLQLMTTLNGQQAVLVPAVSAAPGTMPCVQQSCLATSSALQAGLSGTAADGYATYQVTAPVASAGLAAHTVVLQQANAGGATPGNSPITASYAALQQQQQLSRPVGHSTPMALLQGVPQPISLQQQQLLLPAPLSLVGGLQQQQQQQMVAVSLPPAMLASMLDNCHISQQWM